MSRMNQSRPAPFDAYAFLSRIPLFKGLARANLTRLADHCRLLKVSNYALFHQLANQAYFHGVMIISAVNNIPAPSYPSLYSSVISVAAHEGRGPFTYYYNPSPPVEFGAPGIDVQVAWKDKTILTSTGNSFAAPHIAGLVALILGKHPGLTPFQVKTVLAACASNVRPQSFP